MAKVKVFNLRNESIGEIELSDEVFGAEINEGLLYDVIKAQLASRRQGSANTKVRSEVSGSTKKIYKQKGTGRARHGSIRAPNFRGGGSVHSPKPHAYGWRPPAKMRAGALKSALSMKLKEGRLTIVDTFKLDEVKTKALAGVLTTLHVTKSSLIVDAKANDNLRLSVRNLSDHHFLPPEGVNLYDLLRHEHLILTKDAVAALEARVRNV
ncbi:MAG: 50S ribosomal protein L4 [Sandaracinaceae bacterium]|nr:50S ribosomal protein L4 [Sandaracinaceae bacterium]